LVNIFLNFNQNRIFICNFLALSIGFSSGYKQECAVGPEYWCKSFETAQDCGALRHCTDTVWRYDQKSTGVDSSTNCEWCQKILENTHQGIQHLANNEVCYLIFAEQNKFIFRL
jgi:hypothetical protein